jgi:YfiH family protein
MPFKSTGEIRYYQFHQIGPGVSHAIFTRRGGVSPEPWDALNLGSTVGDSLQRVMENRRLALAALDRDPDSVYDVWQVHGVEVVVADAPLPPETPHLKADVILTNKPGITLLMRFADCVPILLHDPVRKVVGIAHAGWMGTVRGTVLYAVKAMKERFGSREEDILTGIGPSIGPDHYEIGSEVINQVRQAFQGEASSLLSEGKGENVKFDLWKANTLLLEKSGVKHIEVAGLCTACHTKDWYSHRGENGRTGRFGAIIALV